MFVLLKMNPEHQLLFDSIAKNVPLSQAEFDQLTAIARFRIYKKGQFLIHEGGVLRKTHFIQKGSVIAYFIAPNGAEHLIQFAVEGWWISDIQSFNSGKPALLNVQAMEDVELYEFSYDDLMDLQIKVHNIESYFLVITRNAFASFQERVLTNLCLNAEERYLDFVKKYPKLELRFPQKWIASYLGISAEFLSKIKARRLKGL